MTQPRILALAGTASLAAGCLLTTSLDGFSGGASDAGAPDAPVDDAPLDAPVVDTGTEAGPPLDYAGAVLADQPLAYYRFDETGGTTCADSSGHGNTGRLTGTGFTFGAPGALTDNVALGFDGASVVDIGDKLDFAQGAPFTVEAWVRPSVMDTTYRFVWGKMATSGTGSPFNGQWLYVHATNIDNQVGVERWSLGTFGGGGYSRAPLSPAKLTHVVAVLEGTSFHLFLDGADTGNSFVRPYPPYVVNTSSFVVGTNFMGTIDELAVYGAALTPARIKAHFDAAR